MHAPQGLVHASSQAFRWSVGQGSGGRLLSLSLRIGQVSSSNGSLHLSNARRRGIIGSSSWIAAASAGRSSSRRRIWCTSSNGSLNRMTHPSSSSWWSSRSDGMSSLNGSPHLRDLGGRGIVDSSSRIDAPPVDVAVSSGWLIRSWLDWHLEPEGRTCHLIARSGCWACRAPRARNAKCQKVGSPTDVISHTKHTSFFLYWS